MQCWKTAGWLQSDSYMKYKSEKAKKSQLLQQLQDKYEQTIKKPAFEAYRIIFNKTE
jgi:hypothetical protein